VSFGKTLNAHFPSWGQAILALWWPSLTRDMQTEQLLFWSGKADTEYTASDSNEEEEERNYLLK